MKTDADNRGFGFISYNENTQSTKEFAYDMGFKNGMKMGRKNTLKEVQAWVEANHQKDVIWVMPFYEWLEKEVQKD